MPKKLVVPVRGKSDGDALSNLLKLGSDSTLTGLSDGVQAGYEYADQDWMGRAERTARALASFGDPFTVDDLRNHGVPEPDKPQRWGSLFAALRAKGVVRLHGLALHRTQSGESRSLRVWVGTDAVALRPVGGGW